VKKLIPTIIGVLALAAVAVPTAFTTAFATGVPRYQFETAPYLVTVDGTYLHSYVITINPCDGTFTGTGQYPPAPDPATYTETVSGSVTGGGTVINSAATYNTGYVYYLVNGTFDPNTGSFTGTGYDNDGNPTPGSLTIIGSLNGTPTFTSYENHGQFVSSQPDKNDAAHSCIGMPSTSAS
jgi:hypothetical protein